MKLILEGQFTSMRKSRRRLRDRAGFRGTESDQRDTKQLPPAAL